MFRSRWKAWLNWKGNEILAVFSDLRIVWSDLLERQKSVPAGTLFILQPTCKDLSDPSEYLFNHRSILGPSHQFAVYFIQRSRGHFNRAPGIAML